MAVIDADAHVVENERTWSYAEGADRALMPALVKLPSDGPKETFAWAIDGRLRGTGPVSETDSVKAVREMDDVPGRLRHMDQLGTDVQVLFPTFFLSPVTDRPNVERAICRSYNRWLADRCSQGEGRLLWAIVPPTLDVEASIEELRFGKEHGACAVFWRGLERDKPPSDPYFFPIYEEASRLDLPICVHAATGNFYAHDVVQNESGFWRFKVPGITAFHDILTNRLAQRFPRLRFGFVELSAQWVPYALHDFVRRAEKRGEPLDAHKLVAENRIYVACQTDDDLAYVLTYAGGGNLVAGTDYGHADTSSEMEALQRLKLREDVPPETVDAILDANARALYGL